MRLTLVDNMAITALLEALIITFKTQIIHTIAETVEKNDLRNHFLLV